MDPLRVAGELGEGVDVVLLDRAPAAASRSPARPAPAGRPGPSGRSVRGSARVRCVDSPITPPSDLGAAARTARRCCRPSQAPPGGAPATPDPVSCSVGVHGRAWRARRGRGHDGGASALGRRRAHPIGRGCDGGRQHAVARPVGDQQGGLAAGRLHRRQPGAVARRPVPDHRAAGVDHLPAGVGAGRLGRPGAGRQRHRLPDRHAAVGAGRAGAARRRRCASWPSRSCRTSTRPPRENVHLAVLDGQEALYVDTVSGRAAVPVRSRRGGRLPLHATGVGKVLLAHARRAAVRAAVRGRAAPAHRAHRGQPGPAAPRAGRGAPDRGRLRPRGDDARARSRWPRRCSTGPGPWSRRWPWCSAATAARCTGWRRRCAPPRSRSPGCCRSGRGPRCRSTGRSCADPPIQPAGRRPTASRASHGRPQLSRRTATRGQLSAADRRRAAAAEDQRPGSARPSGPPRVAPASSAISSPAAMSQSLVSRQSVPSSRPAAR